MMRLDQLGTGKYRRLRQAGVTLPELVLTVALSGVVIGGTLYGYFQSSRRAEWSSYSLAAHALAVMGVEQTRSAKWDPYAFPPVDFLVTNNFPTQVNLLDVPHALTNGVTATNFTTISNISGTPPLKYIQVNTVWTFRAGKFSRVFTNTVTTYRAPDS